MKRNKTGRRVIETQTEAEAEAEAEAEVEKTVLQCICWHLIGRRCYNVVNRNDWRLVIELKLNF